MFRALKLQAILNSQLLGFDVEVEIAAEMLLLIAFQSSSVTRVSLLTKRNEQRCLKTFRMK